MDSRGEENSGMSRIKTQTRNSLNERALHLLKALVGRYIQDGQPIGSRTLSKQMELSPATIRNVMADLEEMGLVSSPHTSAGRIPTALGYRLFVDSLLQIQSLDKQEEERLRRCLRPEESEQDLLNLASNLLSDLTHMVGMVMLPKRESRTLRHVEFLSLPEKRVLAILVINEEEVENRIVHTSRAYSAADLQQAANYLNQAFAGKDISAVREQLLGEMQTVRENVDRMMQAAIEVADKAFVGKQAKDSVYLAGQSNLLDLAELSDLEKLCHLFAAFGEKQDILHLLDQTLNAQGVQIFIGEESGQEVLGECSVVASTYQVNGQVIGALGVIGPTRMPYQRVIPIVDLTAKLLGSALRHP
jgi:heat-inducible transcriptional repressor